VTHAAAYDLQAIDTVNIDMQDIDSLRADAERAAQMGYSGKLALHPDQVAPITQAFIPTDAAIDHAQRLIDAFQRQQESGLGAFAFEGKMIDRPTIRSAQWVLDRARAAGKA
jgi:citrate lyase beta subunit